MSNSHRIQRRRQKRRSRRLAVLGAIAGIALVAVVLAVLQSRGDGERPAAAGGANADVNAGVTGTGDEVATGLAKVDQPAATGKPLTVSTAEGFTFTVEAVSGGTSPDLRPEGVVATPGQTFAYAEYVLTNTGRQPALLDFPPDVFMRRAVVPAGARNRCIPRLGAAKDVCALPSHSKLVGRLGDSPPPSVTEAGDKYLPAGASYLVRSVVDFPVTEEVGSSDISLYVWAVRFTGDRIARAVPFPE